MLQPAKQRQNKAEIYVICQKQKKTTESRVSQLKELTVPMLSIVRRNHLAA